jgi:hypothetical protein
VQASVRGVAALEEIMTPAITLAGLFLGLIVIAAPVAQFGVDVAFRLFGL